MSVLVAMWIFDSCGSCLRNVVSMFSVIQQEIEWRKTQGLPPGFKSLEKSQPLVAVGADGPLGDQQRMADYFRNREYLAFDACH